MRLYHFGDDPGIITFVPRPVRVPSARAKGMEWLNGPLVWAIEEDFDFLYYFPRECPRIVIWATEQTDQSDTAKWLGSHRAAAYIERQWMDPLVAATLHRYQLPSETFESLGDAGMWVSRVSVVPSSRTTITDLPAHAFETRRGSARGRKPRSASGTMGHQPAHQWHQAAQRQWLGLKRLSVAR